MERKWAQQRRRQQRDNGPKKLTMKTEASAEEEMTKELMTMTEASAEEDEETPYPGEGDKKIFFLI